MFRCLFFAIFFFHAAVSVAQQKILLIGTRHRTEPERMKEIIPVATAIENFHPGIICVEYPMPADTASVIHRSVMHRNEPLIFQRMEALRKEWKVPADITTRIELLQHDQNLSSEVLKRMELQQLFFLSSDLGNADYQGYLIMNKIKNDPGATASLRANFPGFETMRNTFEHKCYARDEYCHLVFPLAAKFDIPYLYPIDDLSTWKEYQKHYNRLQTKDTTDVDKKKFRRHSEAFHQKLQSLPKDSNQWVFLNSPQIIQDLLYAEGYKIDSDITNEDIKLQHDYWVQRNRMMAQHIDAVARKHPDVNIVAFFGASHVGPVLEELNQRDKNYRVITLLDVIR